MRCRGCLLLLTVAVLLPPAALAASSSNDAAADAASAAVERTAALPAYGWNKPHRAAITTTFRLEDHLEADWSGAVTWWVHWHVHLLGFSKVYFFADSAFTVTWLRKLGLDDGHVEIVPSHAWTYEQTDLHEFITRQTDNCAKAYELAAQQGIGWLMHMDVDELFYLARGGTLEHHLRRLSKLRIGSFTYANLEALADNTHMEGSTYFEEVPAGSFKKHPSFFGMSPQELWASPRSIMNKLRFGPPSQGSTTDGTKREYFFSYSNGKSLVRVGRLPKHMRPEPRNHYWVYGKGGDATVRGKLVRNCKAFVYDAIAHATYESKLAKDVYILHFVNVGFLFWRDKYLLLGTFNDGYLQGRFPVPFDSMLASRDAVAKGDENVAFEYFKNTFVCTGTCRDELRDHGIFMEDVDVQQEKRRLEGAAQSGKAGAGQQAGVVAKGRKRKKDQKNANTRKFAASYEL
jgi:hypothetical protein